MRTAWTTALPRLEPLGGFPALLAALTRTTFRAVFTNGSLASLTSTLASLFCYLPHDAIVPGVSANGDLTDLVHVSPRPAAVAPWWMESIVASAACRWKRRMIRALGLRAQGGAIIGRWSRMRRAPMNWRAGLRRISPSSPISW